MEFPDSDNRGNWVVSNHDWRFINRALHRPGESSAIDFVKWNGAQSTVIKRIVSVEVTYVLQVACPEVRNFLHEDSTEIGVVLLLGRMFAQCFYQYWIDELINQSPYTQLSHEQKLWASNVILGTEECHDWFILEIAAFVRERLESYLIGNAERLMEKAACKVEENFLGKPKK